MYVGWGERSLPIRLHDVLVALLVTGQCFLDTPEGRAEMEAGLIELEGRLPQIKEGISVAASRLRKAGIPPEELAPLLGLPAIDDDHPVVVTTETIRTLLPKDAGSLGGMISSDDDLATWRKKIAEVVQVVRGYVEMIYRERRQLKEQAFLAELFALLESMPPVPHEQEHDVWPATGRLIRRVAEFQGFRCGAVCFADPRGLHRVRLGAWHMLGTDPDSQTVFRQMNISGEDYEL